MYRDDGLGGDISNEVHADSVRDLPSLDELTVSEFPDNSLGRTFRFQVKVFTT